VAIPERDGSAPNAEPAGFSYFHLDCPRFRHIDSRIGGRIDLHGDRLFGARWRFEVDQSLLSGHGERRITAQFADVGVTCWKLSNGALVLLKPADFKNDEVLIRARKAGGHSLAPDSMRFTAESATGIVARMGLGKFDSVELGKALSEKWPPSTPTSWSSARTPGKRVATRSGDRVPTAVPPLHRRAPRQELSPGYWFARRMNEVLTQNHPRRGFLTADDLKSTDLDQGLAFYNAQFADASGFVFTIAGNLDPAAVRPPVEKWIGGLPSAGHAETWRNHGIEEAPGVLKANVTKGIEPRSSVRIVFHGKAPWTLDQAHRITSLADVLAIRLREELREDRGGVYGVGAYGDLQRYLERITS